MRRQKFEMCLKMYTYLPPACKKKIDLFHINPAEKFSVDSVPEIGVHCIPTTISYAY